ncbi:MAG: N-acetyltransferase [Ruminococcus sp.]|nr:N-acetyltransferase [Ruminococcus sp.]
MKRIIKSMSKEYIANSLIFVEKVFIDSEDKESGALVRRIVEEIRSKKYYLPELDLIMVNEFDEIIGFIMFSRIHLGGKFSDSLLMLNPVAVRTDLQRQHISKQLIEYGFDMAKKMGYKAVIVEGNPQNYRNRGFETSSGYGITAGKSIDLPSVECLMVKELVANGLKNISGVLEYTDYSNMVGGDSNE